MLLKLKSGETVEAAKDCECNTHNGPHWIHTDRIWKEHNLSLKEKGTELALRGYIQEEIARLNDKKWQMQAHGIAEIVD